MTRRDLFLAGALTGFIITVMPTTRDEGILVVNRALDLVELFEQYIDTEDEQRGKNKPSDENSGTPGLPGT